jgi:TPR repeat protein
LSLGHYSLGRLYFRLGRYDEALHEFGVAAESDYIPAIHFLGRMHASGKGCVKDLAKAQQHLERASKGGSVLAKGTLAYLLVHGHLGLGGIVRGVFLYVGMWIDLFVVMCTEGQTSDRFR